MNPQIDPNDIGRQLGADGVNGVVAKVEQYCAHEVQRIALENHAPIVALKAEFALLAEEAKAIEDQLRNAPPPGDLRHFRRKKIFAWVVTGLLTVTAFSLAALTFAPFRLGWQSYLFCTGIAIVVPFLMEELFEGAHVDVLIKPLAIVAIASGVASLMLMADVRGNLLKHEVETPPGVVIDDGQAERPTPQEDFYGKSTDLLTLATVLLSLAMELGSGLAMRRAWAKAPHNIEDFQRLRRDKAIVHGQMVLKAAQITRLEAEPAIFKAQFWRDFYKSMLTHTVESRMKKLLILAAAALILPHALAATAPQHLNLVVALDLSKSTGVKNPDGKTEFQKNVDGVSGVLAQVPAGTHVTVIGITDRSFAQPFILLSASVPDDSGYFGERLSAAQWELIRVWKQRSAKLEAKFPGTDILGALDLAGQIFEQRQPSESTRKVLVIFSDMRNHTRELDLETTKGLTMGLKSEDVRRPSADLQGVRIFALGVEGTDSTTRHWQSLKSFWTEYLSERGAALDAFSILRELALKTAR